MILPSIVVQAIYVIVALMGVGLALVLWRNQDKPGARTLAIVNLGIAWWSGFLFISTITPDAIAVASVQLVYIGVLTVVMGIFIFGLEYTGRERFISVKLFAVMATYAIVMLFFVFVNPDGLFFATLDPSGTMVVQEWGLAFIPYVIGAYIFVVGFTLLILDLLFRSNRSLYRGQAVALFLATVFPVIGNLFWVFDLVIFDTTPMGFAASAALFTFAIVRYQLADLTPVARDKVVDNIRDGMFVIDTDDRIVDTNPAARKLLPIQPDEVIGMAMDELFADYPEIHSTYTELTANRDPAESTLELGDLYLNITITPITDDRERHIGWVMLTQDVSEQKRSERELEQQIEKLDQFASLVSHDLRNPINVARGYIQQTQATGNLEFLEKTEESMDRMESIIDDVLALAREGQEVTEPTQTQLAHVARTAWDSVETGDATLEINSPAEKITILADETRLQRLLENLFRNSLEHGVGNHTDGDQEDELEYRDDELPPGYAENHTVTVGIDEQTGGELSFYVADNGVGIPPDKREQVLQDGFTTNRNGTGLGLAIVRQISHAHGWDVSVSESADGGASFDITGVGKPMPTA